MSIILAAISGSALINAMVYLLIWGLIIWVAWYALNAIAPPQPWRKVAEVLLIVLSALIIINLLLGLVGQPFIRFH